MNARDELAQDWAAAFNSDTPVVDYLHAAGYRKPRTITTAEELDALPGGSVVRSDMGVMWEKDEYLEEPECPWWCSPGDSHQYPARRITLPATVLHEGGTA